MKIQKYKILPKHKKSWPRKSQRVASVARIWFSTMRKHSLSSSLETNKMMVVTCQKDQLKMFSFGWPAKLKRRPLCIYRPWRQNKCRILPQTYARECIKALGTHTFRPQSLDVPTGLRTITLSIRHSIMVKQLGPSLHFQRTMATKISGYQSIGLLRLGYFGK